jgi:hypothetical protein
MIRRSKLTLRFAMIAAAFAAQSPLRAQEAMKHDQMMHEEAAKTLYTGKFHGRVHSTEGRATIYEQPGGKFVLRLTNFKTSNGPDVHVILVAIKNADDDVKSDTERIELGKLKGNEGDQNYQIPAGTDLSKFRTVSIYCERFNANFGVAPLEKF